MALSTTINRKDYVGDNSTVAFSFPYLVYDAAHMQVYLNGVPQVAGFTISGVGTVGGITVTFSVAPATDVAILLYRSVPVTQLSSYGVAGAFPAKSTEKALDLQTMVDQQQDETFGRGIKIPLTSTAKNVDFPDPASTANHGKVVRVVSATQLDTMAVSTTDFANPLTTKGDLVSHNGSVHLRVGVGANDTIPVADSTVAHGWTWKTPAQYAATFLLGLLTTKGDTIIRTAAVAVRKAIGSNGQILAADSNDTDGAKYVNVGLPNFRGVVRSHPDSDSAATKIRADLEMVTTNDGHYYAPAQGLIFDKAVTGSIGGMQAAAVNSTWNKLYYTRKRSDGSEGLWGLRAKNYLADTSFTTATDSVNTLREAAANTKIAQSFQLTNAGKLEFVDVQLAKQGAPTGNHWYTIEADSSGSPSGTPLATSDKYDVSRMPTTNTWVRFPFRTPATLSSATTYWLVYQGDFTISGANYMQWRSVTAGGYASGSAKTFDGASTWSADGNLDNLFKTYVTQNDTALSLPSGYDQYVQIGWFYINSSGNILPFQANDRHITCVFSGNSGANWRFADEFTIGTVPTLVNAETAIPPGPVVAKFTSDGNGANNSFVGFLEFQGSTVIVANQGEGYLGTLYSNGTLGGDATLLGVASDIIPVEYQAINIATNIAWAADLWVTAFEW